MTREGRRSYNIPWWTRVATCTAAGAVLLASCGSNEDSNGNTSAQAQGTTNEQQAPTTPTIELTQDWANILPERKVPEPRFMTEEGCFDDFWLDEEGKRQPPASKDPLIVRTDGRCNVPVTSEINGMYYSPEQAGPAPIKTKNGDALGFECWTEGQAIQDVRGSTTSSNIWLGVAKLAEDGQGIALGFISETNAGFIDEQGLQKCA